MQNMKDGKKFLIGGVSFIILGIIMTIVLGKTVSDLVWSFRSNSGIYMSIGICATMLLQTLIPFILVICGISIIRKRVKLFSAVIIVAGVLYLFYYSVQPLATIAILSNTVGVQGWFSFFVLQNHFGFLYISVFLQSMSFIMLGIVALLKNKNIKLACIPTIMTLIAIILLIVFCLISDFDVNPISYFTLTSNYPIPLYIIENIVKVIGFVFVGLSFCNADTKGNE